MERLQWQAWVIGMIGLWLIVSPYVLSVPFEDEIQAGSFRWSFVGPGSVLLLLSIGALATHQTWETGLAAAMGLWLLATPWIGGFMDTQSALLSAVTAGVALVGLGVWSMITGRFRRAE